MLNKGADIRYSEGRQGKLGIVKAHNGSSTLLCDCIQGQRRHAWLPLWLVGCCHDELCVCNELKPNPPGLGVWQGLG